MSSRKKGKQIGLYVCLLFLCFTVDQITKKYAVEYFAQSEEFPLISDILVFSYVENRGAAFGLFQNQRIIFLISAGILTIGMALFFQKTWKKERFFPLHVSAIFLYSGALGNAWDRLYLGYVIDFIYIKKINFPVFNVADIYVTLSTICIVILLLFYYKEEEIEGIFRNRRREAN